MNGVRRLLGSASSQPPEPTTSPQPSVLPLFPPKNSANHSWLPQETNQSMGPLTSSPKPTAALSFKKDRPKPSLSNDNEGYDHSWSSSNPHHSPRLHHAYHNNNNIQGSSPYSRSSSTSSARRNPINSERNPSRKSAQQSTDSTWVARRDSFRANTRDELLLSLMASEAVVDSRDYNVLNTEEVEELKTEEAALTSRLGAMTKKLALETKIRDAAVSLSKVNSAHKRVSVQSEQQLESAHRRVDAAQREVWRLSELASDVGKCLLEHRAAVLSISVRNMEKKMTLSQSEDSGYDSSNRSTLMTPATANSVFSLSSSKQSKFDGAHLFAGHENAIVPRRHQSPESASREIISLEQKLKAAATSLAGSSKIQAEMKKELSHLTLEKQEVETRMGMELQTSEDTIAAMEQQMLRLRGLDQEVEALKQEQTLWEEERLRFESYEREVSTLNARVQELEIGISEEKAGGVEEILGELRESHQRELSKREADLEQLKKQLEEERAGWERDRNALEDEKMDDLSQLHEEMDRLRAQDEQVVQQANNELNTTLNSLRRVAQQFNVAVGERDPQTSSMQHLLNAIVEHFDRVYGRMEQLEKGGNERSSKARQLETELRSALDKHQATAKELEEVKRERDAIRRETLSSAAQSLTSSPERNKMDSMKLPPVAIVTPETSEYGPEAEGAKFIAALQPLWGILPSPEARASKFSSNNARSYRGSPSTSNVSLPGTNGSPNSSANGQTQPTSLSELDVRSLKTLYDPRQQSGAANSLKAGNGQFTLEAFISRVNAVVADDRALIERLLRFAQAHDLLKKNAERAQKLAQDGNIALETYQRQVKLLESRNSTLSSRVAELQDELRLLHDAIERATADKHQLEAHAAEQAETCRQLGEANDTLSARALTLAEEAANAPEMVRKQLDDCKRQLEESKKVLDERGRDLENARDEIEAMRSAEQGQRIALLDELNTMQTENGQLRAQLRAAKSGR